VYHCVGQSLHCLRVFLQKLRGRIQAGPDHRAAEHILAPPEGTGVGNDPHIGLVLEHAHDRLMVADGIHLPRAHGGQGGARGGEFDKLDVLGQHASAHQHQRGHHGRQRPDSGDAHAAPTEVRGRAEARHGAGGNPQRNLRCTRQQHEGTVGLVPALQADRVLEGARDDVTLAGLHRLHRMQAAAEIMQFNRQPFGTEVAQPVRDGQGQATQGRRCPKADRDAGLLGFALSQRRAHGQARQGRCSGSQQVPAVQPRAFHPPPLFRSSFLWG